MQTNQSQEIQWLQGLRGVACILVVLVHARYFMLSTPSGPLADQLFIPGAAGVDLFFVLSGFIMAYTSSRPGVRPVDFLTQRFTRIWPPYAVMTFFWFLFVSGGSLSSLLSANVALPIIKSLLFIPNDPHAPLYFNVTLPLGWTLEFEAYFYLVFALSMLFGRLRWTVLFSWLIFSALVYPISRRGLDLDVRADLGYSFGYAALMTNPIVLEFLFGVIAAAVYMSRIRIRSVRLCWNLLFMATCLALWSCYANYHFHGPLKWGIAAALLVIVLALVSKTITVQFPAVILWLGRISFSLYLTHTATQQLLSKFAEQNDVDVHNWWFVFISTATAIFVAYFFYELVEVRLCNMVRKALKRTGTPKRVPLNGTVEA